MIRTKIKKLISISLIIMFILSIINLNQISFASNENIVTQGNINVSNIENGVKVTLYQIATMEIEEETNIPKEGYSWNETIKNWIEENFSEYSNAEDFYKIAKNNQSRANEFYDKIISAIKQTKINLEPYMEKTSEGEASYPITEDNLNGDIKFSNVDIGTYIVIIENGYMVYNPSVVNVLPEYDNTTNTWSVKEKNVTIKASSPSITKTVTTKTDKKDNYSSADNIFYIITSDIPAYLENSASKKYTIIDEMDKSLELNKKSILILGFINSEDEVATSIESYTIDEKEENNKMVYTINFDYNMIERYETIKVMYNAKLVKNQNLIIGENGNNNYAYIEYSNNPYIASSIQKQSAEKVTVYTYGMEIKSVDKENNNIQLSRSEFSIENLDGEKLYFVKGNDGEYYKTVQNDENAIINLEVNSNGILSIKGLDEGEYIIKQTKAPEGYYISTKSYKIEIKDSDLDGILNEPYSLIFQNSKGFTLPVTGGNGIIILASAGIILSIIGIILIISITKKRKKLKDK